MTTRPPIAYTEADKVSFAKSEYQKILNLGDMAFRRTPEQITAAHSAASQSEVEAMRPTRTLEAELLELQTTRANALVQMMVMLWQPRFPTMPTTAEMLAARGTDAKGDFDAHAAHVSFLWVDSTRREILVSAMARHHITVSADNQGKPVFSCRKPFTVNADGTITLN